VDFGKLSDAFQIPFPSVSDYILLLNGIPVNSFNVTFSWRLLSGL